LEWHRQAGNDLIAPLGLRRLTANGLRPDAFRRHRLDGMLNLRFRSGMVPG